jgi:alkylation response protein AidB-like acyl-CoA dehydrogenase
VWVLDGAKRFITNAGQAGTYIVTARTGETAKGDAEISAFIVPADTPGFSVGRLEDKLGLHASATGELRFEGARIPASNLLGERGTGFRMFSPSSTVGGSASAPWPSAWPGGLDATSRTPTRLRFGRPIGTFRAAFARSRHGNGDQAARARCGRRPGSDQGRDAAWSPRS